MNLVASMVARDEVDRYLELAVEHALTYCDHVVILDDGSTDELADPEWITETWLDDPVHVIRREREGDGPTFDHEGRTRQHLLEVTMERDPTHIIVIDADEFVAHPAALLEGIEAGTTTGYRICMEEVWRADDEGLDIRCDGGWHPHPVPIVFRAPRELYGDWRIQDQALASGREPVALRKLYTQGDVTDLDVEILHFGWVNLADRDGRFQRYVNADGGRFHRNAHIQSIAWPDSQIDFERIVWPEGLDPVRDRLLERANREQTFDELKARLSG